MTNLCMRHRLMRVAVVSMQRWLDEYGWKDALPWLHDYSVSNRSLAVNRRLWTIFQNTARFLPFNTMKKRDSTWIVDRLCFSGPPVSQCGS